MRGGHPRIRDASTDWNRRAALSADVQPAIGAALAVGRSVGRVVRHFAEGFAVKFERPVVRDYLKHLIIKT